MTYYMPTKKLTKQHQTFFASKPSIHRPLRWCLVGWPACGSESVPPNPGASDDPPPAEIKCPGSKSNPSQMSTTDQPKQTKNRPKPTFTESTLHPLRRSQPAAAATGRRAPQTRCAELNDSAPPHPGPMEGFCNGPRRSLLGARAGMQGENCPLF